jgi:uncharacterized protein YybS (DUF2232 family)
VSDKLNPLLKGRILDVIKGSVVTAALFLAFIGLPLFGIPLGFFAPAPAVFLSLKSGRITGIAIVVITAAVVAAVAGDATMAAVYLLQSGIMSLALAEFLVRLKGGARSIVYAVAVNLVFLVAAAALYGYLTGANLHMRVAQGIQGSIAETAMIYEKAGVKGDELKTLQDSMHQAGAVVLRIYPALTTVGLGVMAALNLWLLGRIAIRAKLPIYLGDFRQYRNPEPLVWLLIVSGFSMLVQQDVVQLIALNILLVVCSLYSVQGLAVISHFFRKYSIPVFLRVIGWLFLIFQPFMLVAVAALGVFDIWGDFRSPKQQNL